MTSSSIQFSVIVPAYNLQGTIKSCLGALSGFLENGAGHEIIVVDAGSTDDTASVIKTFPCKLIQSTKPLNPSQARNLGAGNAKGDVLIFIDSDVVLSSNAINRFCQHFEKDPNTAVTGIYSMPDERQSFTSAFQTLFLKYRFSNLNTLVTTPTSAILAVRKEDFDRVNGFNENLRTYEDFDLGRRLAKDGIRFHIDAQIKGEHLKDFSLAALLKDYWLKAKNMMAYRLSHAEAWRAIVSPNEIGLPLRFFWSVMMSMPLALCSTFTFWSIVLWVIYAALVFPFLLYLKKEKGVSFAVRGGVTLFICQLTSSFAMLYALLQFILSKTINAPNIKLKLPKFVNIGKRIFYKPGLPVQLVFFVTSKCNLHCEHCFYLPYLNKAKNELSIDEIGKISKNMSDLLWVAFTGGEPLLRKDLDQIAEIFYTNNRARKFTITTNGILKEASIDLLERVLKKIPKAQLMVYFSIDGLPQTHDQIRRVSNGYQRTVATLKAAKELKKTYPNLFVSTITTCTAHNQEEMIPLANKILDEMKPDNMVVNLVRGELEDPDLKNVEIRNYHEFIKIQQDAIQSGRLGYFNFFGKRFLLAKEARQKEIITDVFVNNRFVTPCYAGHLSAVLHETGEVAPCEILSTRYGNVRDYNYDFRKLWEAQEVRAHAKGIIKNKCFCTYECALTTNVLFNPKYLLKSLQTKSQVVSF